MTDGILGTPGAAWTACTKPTDPLADVLAGIAAIERMDREPHPCALGRHVIHPRARAGSLTTCGNCGGPVIVPVRVHTV